MRVSVGVEFDGLRFNLMLDSADVQTHSFMSDRPEKVRGAVDAARQAFQRAIRVDTGMVDEAVAART